MPVRVSASFFDRLREAIGADLKVAVEEHLLGDDRSGVCGFVIFYQPLHAVVGWRFFTENVARTAERSSSVHPAGHPGGPRFAVGDALACAKTSARTEALLAELREAVLAWQTASDDESDDDGPGIDGPFADVLVSCIRDAQREFDRLPLTQEFVAFVADYDLGVSLRRLRQTVPSERLGRVFPAL